MSHLVSPPRARYGPSEGLTFGGLFSPLYFLRLYSMTKTSGNQTVSGLASICGTVAGELSSMSPNAQQVELLKMGERFERHRQPWRQDEIQKLHALAMKGMSLRAIAKALTRTEESVKDRAKADRLRIVKLR